MRFARLAAASAALTLAVGVLTVSTSFADQPPPEFQSGPNYSVGSDAVTATGHIIHLGQERVTVTLVADAVVNCRNPHGKIVKGLKRTATGSEDSGSIHNGSFNFNVTTGVLTDTCPGKMTVANVDFTKATLTVTDSSTGALILSNETTSL